MVLLILLLLLLVVVVVVAAVVVEVVVAVLMVQVVMSMTKYCGLTANTTIVYRLLVSCSEICKLGCKFVEIIIP